MGRRDLFELVLLAAIWGASFLFMKIAVSEFGPIGLIACRVSVAAVFLFAILAAKGAISTLPNKILPFFILGAINTAIPFVLFAYALKTLPVGYGAVINATVPLFGALTATMLGLEKISFQKGVGLAVGFGGVLVLVASKLTAVENGLAIAAGLLAALLYGIAAYYSKKQFAGDNPLVVAAGSLMGATALLIPFTWFAWPTSPISTKAWLYGIALGIVCTGIAYLLYFRLIKHVGPTKAITVTYLIPVFGMLWGFIVLQELITWNMIVGCLVILAGTTMVIRSPHHPPSSTTKVSVASSTT